MTVSKYYLQTDQFERKVIPGSARESSNRGCPGRIDFEDEPEQDKDRGNQLEKWLEENTAIRPRHEDGKSHFMYMGQNSLCSIITYQKTSRDRFSSTDPLKYERTVEIKIQPEGAIPQDLNEVLQIHGYRITSSSNSYPTNP